MTAKILNSRISSSIDLRSPSVHSKRISTVSSESKRTSSLYNNRPTPLDFENFIHWFCLEMQVPEYVVVIKKQQEKLPILRRRRAVSGKFKSIKITKHFSEDSQYHKKDSSINESYGDENVIKLISFYDPHGNLVQIVIPPILDLVHIKIVKAVSICLPFHPHVSKLIILKGRIHSILLHEISKILMHSNITDVCLDGTNVSEGNYHVLLDHATNLKYLSVSRCNINNKVCKEIFSRIDFGGPAEKSVMVLDISSNNITDVGAKYIGNVLRKNRHLLHLNLADNKITDNGFNTLMDHLKMFPLTDTEILESRRRYNAYCKDRLAVYNKCVHELANTSKTEYTQTEKRSFGSVKRNKSKKLKKSQISDVQLLPPIDNAAKMTDEIVGVFQDPFDKNNIVGENDCVHSIGNFKLCSLNIAYNKLGYRSLLKILDVLEYQSDLDKKVSDTGLMRSVLVGNPLPIHCLEYEIINEYLLQAVASCAPISFYSPYAKTRSSVMFR